MPTEFLCKACSTRFRSAKPIDIGKMIKCPKCAQVFKVEGDAPASSPSSPSAATKTTAQPPQRKPVPAAVPVAEVRPSSVRRRDRDDDDYDDRPRKKRRKQESGSNGMMIGLILGLGALALLVVVGIVVGVVVFSGDDKNKTVAGGQSNPPPPMLLPPSGSPANLPRPPSNTNTPSNPSNNTPPKTPDSAPTEPISAGPSGPASVQDIYSYVLKSSALILNFMDQGLANGTGEVVDVQERLLLTNHHVIMDQKKLYVYFPIYENGKLVPEKERYFNVREINKVFDTGIPAELIASDPKRDLALIRVARIPPGIEALSMAKNLCTVGDKIHSVGNPGASGSCWVYTTGTVRTLYHHKWKASDGHGGHVQDLEADVIETDSPTNQGDSGGPLVNDRGELVGVTEGYAAGGARQISTFISLTEARPFVEREFQRKFNKPWKPATRAPLRIRNGSAGGDVTTLIANLDHKDAKMRASAAQSLGEMGAEAKLAIRRLIKSLKDPDELTSRCAAEALAKIGSPGRDDVPALTEALKDAKPEVRRYAASAIGQIGPDAASTTDRLVEAFSDSDERTREAAVRSVGNLGAGAKSAGVPALKNALKDDSKNVRIAAASSIANLLNPPAAEDVPLFVSILKHQDPEASVFGARALAKLGKQAKSAVPELTEAAKTGEPGVRRSAIETLAAIGPDKTLVPVYLAALKESDSGVRQSALLALSQLSKELDKEKDKETIAAIVDAAKDSDAQVRKAALTAVGKLGRTVISTAAAKQLMPPLIEAVKSKNKQERDEAMEIIGDLGPLATKDAVVAMIQTLEDAHIKLPRDKEKAMNYTLPEADEEFLNRFAKTCGKIGQTAVGPLMKAMETDNVNFGLFIGCCRALGEIGPPARAAIGHLATVSGSGLPGPIVFEADRALRKIRK